VEESGAVRMTDDARKAVLVAWQDRKKEELRHPSWARRCRSD
jgi:CRISPR-associated protein Cas1